jgi:hypothetical protein
MVLSNSRRLALFLKGVTLLLPPDERKGGCGMVSYADLFQYTLVLIGLAGLIIAILNLKKEVTARLTSCGYFF